MRNITVQEFEASPRVCASPPSPVHPSSPSPLSIRPLPESIFARSRCIFGRPRPLHNPLRGRSTRFGGPRNWVRYCDTVAAPPPEGEPGVAFGSDLRRISLSPRHTHESAPQGDIRSLLRVSVSTATVVGSSCTLA